MDFIDNGWGTYLFAAMWPVGGIAGLIAAIQRPITCEDSIGYTAVLLPPLLWDFGYWWSWIANVFSNGLYGRPTSYVGGLLYGTITIMVLFLSRHLQDHPEGPCARRRSIGLVE